jgi:hypothetical protein
MEPPQGRNPLWPDGTGATNLDDRRLSLAISSMLTTRGIRLMFRFEDDPTRPADNAGDQRSGHAESAWLLRPKRKSSCGTLSMLQLTLPACWARRNLGVEIRSNRLSGSLQAKNDNFTKSTITYLDGLK